MGVQSYLAAPFRGLKSLLTTQHFASEYEMLCTELSLQQLRLRLWGQLVSPKSFPSLALAIVKSTTSRPIGRGCRNSLYTSNSCAGDRLSDEAYVSL